MALKFYFAQNLPQVAIRPSSLKMHLIKRDLTRGNIDFLSPPSPLSCVVFCLFVIFLFFIIFCVVADVQNGAGPVQVNHWRWGSVDFFKDFSKVFGKHLSLAMLAAEAEVFRRLYLTDPWNMFL